MFSVSGAEPEKMDLMVILPIAVDPTPIIAMYNDLPIKREFRVYTICIEPCFLTVIVVPSFLD